MNQQGELKKLIENLKQRTGLTQQQIATKAGYGKNSLSQMLTRKGSHQTTIDQLKLAFRDVLTESTSVLKSDGQQVPLGDFKLTVSDYVKQIQQHNEFLQDLVKSNLDQLASTQTILLAQVKAGLQWEAHVAGKGDPKKVESVLHEINKLVAEQLGLGVEMDKRVVAGS